MRVLIKLIKDLLILIIHQDQKNFNLIDQLETKKDAKLTLEDALF